MGGRVSGIHDKDGHCRAESRQYRVNRDFAVRVVQDPHFRTARAKLVADLAAHTHRGIGRGQDFHGNVGPKRYRDSIPIDPSNPFAKKYRNIGSADGNL